MGVVNVSMSVEWLEQQSPWSQMFGSMFADNSLAHLIIRSILLASRGESISAQSGNFM